MKYGYIQPAAILRDYIRDYVVIHFKMDAKDSMPLKPFPAKPQGGICFYVKGSIQILNQNLSSKEKREKVQIVGQQEYRQTFLFSHEVLLIDVIFQPGALYKLLGIPMTEFINKNVDAELIFGPSIRFLIEQMENANGYKEMINLIELFLFEKIKKLKSYIHPVEKIGEYILDNPNKFNLETTAKKACLSFRQFERRFTQQVGVTPRFYQRMSRFRNAFELKLKRNDLTWLDIAWQTGYSDYQHLAKDCKQFSGNTPAVLIDEENNSPQGSWALSWRPIDNRMTISYQSFSLATREI